MQISDRSSVRDHGAFGHHNDAVSDAAVFNIHVRRFTIWRDHDSFPNPSVFQGDVGASSDMLMQQVSVIHAVEMIAAQDEVIFVRALQKVAEVLAHRVRRALVPAGALSAQLLIPRAENAGGTASLA